MIATVEEFPLEQCQEEFLKIPRSKLKIVDTQICVHSPGNMSDTCQGETNNAFVASKSAIKIIFSPVRWFWWTAWIHDEPAALHLRHHELRTWLWQRVSLSLHASRQVPELDRWEDQFITKFCSLLFTFYYIIFIDILSLNVLHFFFIVHSFNYFSSFWNIISLLHIQLGFPPSASWTIASHKFRHKIVLWYSFIRFSDRSNQFMFCGFFLQFH